MKLTLLSLFLIAQLLISHVQAEIITSDLNTSNITNLPVYGNQGPIIKAIGDINSDGFTDFAIGMPTYSLNRGQVLVIYGTGNGLPDIDYNNITSSQGFTIGGDGGGDYFGASITALGDFSGDGIDDFAIGAWFSTTPLYGVGSVWVIFGHNSSSSFTSNEYITNFRAANGGYLITVSVSSTRFGFSLAGPGDINGDGLADIVIGAPYHEGSTGRVYVIYGSVTSGLTSIVLTYMTTEDGFYFDGPSTGSYFGWSVAGVGDWNGDGKPDFAIGAPFVYTVYVVYGVKSANVSIPISSLNESAGFKITSDSYNIGYALDGNGDVNNDGKTDLIIGSAASSITDSKAFIVFGTNESIQSDINLSNFTIGQALEISTSNTYSGLGYAFSIEGDLNGDSIDDILISEPGIPYEYGTLYVIFGTTTLSQSQIFNPDTMDSTQGYNITSSQINGASTSNYFGVSVCGSIDLNNDGKNDILLGETISGKPNATVYIFY